MDAGFVIAGRRVKKNRNRGKDKTGAPSLTECILSWTTHRRRMRIFCVFVPNETCLHKNNETGELEEICSLCYYDFTLYQFVWIDSSDGVFFKKDKYVRDKRDFSHPEKDEIALRFLVKS